MKTAIIVLSILLGVVLLAFAGTMLYRYLAPRHPTTAVVPDNLIDPAPEGEDPGNPQATAPGAGSAPASPDGSGDSTQTTASSNGTSVTDPKTATVVTLYERHPGDNVPFDEENFFPGDTVTKYYDVRVTHKAPVVLHYRATVRPGYEKLAEVLNLRVKILDGEEVLYDGPVIGMPESVNRTLGADGRTESELYYEVTGSLDTSVGNEFMDEALVLDFNWWVEGEDVDNLAPPTPQTSDIVAAIPWVIVIVALLAVLIVVWRRSRKDSEEEDDHA